MENTQTNTKTPNKTKYTDAVFTKIVALATEVNSMLQCQALISAANANEATATNKKFFLLFNSN